MDYAENVVTQVMATLEPLGLYLVDRGGYRMRPDGTFETQTIIEAPPAQLAPKPTPRLPAPQPTLERNMSDECE